MTRLKIGAAVAAVAAVGGSALALMLLAAAPAADSVDTTTGASSLVAAIGPQPAHGINALTFDTAENGYVSDSFAGVIWKVPTYGGTPTVWKSDPLLGPGTPFGSLTAPFGANGVEFSNDRQSLFVANTAFQQIIQIAVNADGSAGAASILITGHQCPGRDRERPQRH
jgi:hypothetical protein